MSDPQGRMIAGRYRFTRKLGSGAMGAVWLAHDEVLDRTVAAKELLLPPGLDDAEAEQARQRALREGRIAARIRHANAVTVFDVVDDNGRPVLIMEYLPSRSLADELVERGSLPPAEAARIGAEVASALTAAHAAGIVHRDVKPANILLGDEQGSDVTAIKLTDFGISRAVGDVTVTSTGILAGSPAYLAPEAARGQDPTPASDVFSLGATLYRAVEGGLPFGDQTNPIAVLHAVAVGKINPPTQAGPLTATLNAMLAPEPADRPTMPQVQRRLHAVATGQTPPTATATFAATDATDAAEAADATDATDAATVLTRQPDYAGSADATTLTDPSTQMYRPQTVMDPAAYLAGQAPYVEPVDPPRKSRKGVYTALAAALLVVVAALVVVLTVDFGADENPAASAGGPGTSSERVTPVSPTTTTTTTRTTTTTTTSRTPEFGAADFEAIVTQFYEAMPEDIDAGWDLLTPELQDVGRERFDRYWSSLGPITIVEPAKADGRTVTVGFQIDFPDKNRAYFQRNEMDVTVLDGKPMIASMSRLEFERIEG